MQQQSGWTATPSPNSAIRTIFTKDALPYTTLPKYPGFGQAPIISLEWVRLGTSNLECRYECKHDRHDRLMSAGSWGLFKFWQITDFLQNGTKQTQLQQKTNRKSYIPTIQYHYQWSWVILKVICLCSLFKCDFHKLCNQLLWIAR